MCMLTRRSVDDPGEGADMCMLTRRPVADHVDGADMCMLTRRAVAANGRGGADELCLGAGVHQAAQHHGHQDAQ